MGLFQPSNFSEGGGLVDDVNAECTFRCVMFDYNGSVAVPVPAIHLHGVDEEGEEFDEYYSAGSADRLRASEDGTTFEEVTEGATLNRQSKAGQLLAAVVNAGIDESVLEEDDLSVLDGYTFHLARRADIERKGLVGQENQKRKRTILLPTAVVAEPGKSPKKKAVKKGKAAPKKKAIDDESVDEVVVQALENAGGEIPLAKLSQLVFRAGKGNPKLKDITKRAQEDDYLQDDSRPFGFDGETLTYEG